jgi:hypothetical protein
MSHALDDRTMPVTAGATPSGTGRPRPGRGGRHRGTGGTHARGTNIIPFSLHNIDEMLSDLGTGIGRSRFAEWLLPVDPGAYRRVTKELMARHRPTAAACRRALIVL